MAVAFYNLAKRARASTLHKFSWEKGTSATRSTEALALSQCSPELSFPHFRVPIARVPLADCNRAALGWRLYICEGLNSSLRRTGWAVVVTRRAIQVLDLYVQPELQRRSSRWRKRAARQKAVGATGKRFAAKRRMNSMEQSSVGMPCLNGRAVVAKESESSSAAPRATLSSWRGTASEEATKVLAATASPPRRATFT